MKRRHQWIISLLLAVLLLAGCKENTPLVNLGTYAVKIPGTIEKTNEQLPLTAMGLDVTTPLVMTTAQTMPNNNEVYLAISIEWEQTLNALNLQKSGQLDQKTYMDSVQNNIIEYLTLGATVGELRPVTYGSLPGNMMTFDMVQSADSTLSVWPATRGELVAFISEKRLIVLIYAAELSAFNSRHREVYFSSITLTQP